MRWPQIGSSCNATVDFLSLTILGLEEAEAYLSTLHEYVALVTFGHETKLQVRFTSDYTKIRDTIGMYEYLYFFRSR